MEANAVDAEQVAGAGRAAGRWREQLAALQRRQRVFATTLAAIDRAEQATMKTATRYLEKHMVRDLATVTDGRYRRVRVDDKTLDIEVYAPEKDDWVAGQLAEPGHARPRLPRRATRAGPPRDRRPPAAAGVRRPVRDPRRRAGVAGARPARAIAADFQVIYLTTSPRYDEAADAVVVLDGPTAPTPALPRPRTGGPGDSGGWRKRGGGEKKKKKGRAYRCR